MKIMFYNDDISIASGGTERVLTNLASQFSNNGHQCIFVTYRKSETEYPLDSKVQRVVITNNVKRSLSFVQKLEVMQGIRHIVKAEKPEVLVTFGVGMISRSLFATIGLPVKNIISYQCSPFWEFRLVKDRWLMRTLHQRTDGIVFQTEEAKDYLPKRMQAKGKILYNQVDERFYDTTYNGERRDIVSVGRLKGMKNYKMLINAFARISDEISDNLLIYGTGALYDELQSQIKELHLENRVFLKGLCNDVPNAIKSAKLFVLSSDHEGCPNVLMEAMALGIPCVSTACLGGGPQMLFGAELKDCLVPANNPQAMADKILELLRDDEKRNRVASIGKQKSYSFQPREVFKEWESYVMQFK